jgi:hypothetical protein
MNRKKKIRQAMAAIAVILLLPAIHAAASDVLSIYPAAGGEKQSVSLDKIRSITFEDGNLKLNTLAEAGETGHALDAIGRIVFEKDPQTGIAAAVATDELRVYSPAPGLVTVKSPVKITRLALYGISGVLWRTSRPEAPEATLNIAAMPAGIYLLQVETAQKVTTKKFIKK